MHILIIPSEQYVPPEAPLLGIFQQDQAKALARNFHKIGIVAPSPRSLRLFGKRLFGWKYGIESYEDEGIRVFSHHSWCWLPRTTHACRQFINNGLDLFELYAKEQGLPDVIHAHNVLFAGLLAQKISQQHGIPYLITEHSSAFARNLAPRWAYNQIRQAYSQARQLVAVSPCLSKLLAHMYSLPLERFTWVPNVLDRQFASPELLVQQIPQKPFVFLNVASLDENKGHRYLLKAFQASFRGNDQVVLRIAGDGALRQSLEKLCVDLDIDSQVTFLGRIPRNDILKEMTACHAFVLSSLYETFGVVLLEALACGKPLVATACGGPECIVNNNNGLLVPPGDAIALSEGMKKLVEKYTLFDSVTIRKECLDNFGEDAFVKAILPILQQTLQREFE